MNSNERYLFFGSDARRRQAGRSGDAAVRAARPVARGADAAVRPAAAGARDRCATAAHCEQPAEEPAAEQTPEESRIDADKALAELEAELFAAAKQVDRETPRGAGGAAGRARRGAAVRISAERRFTKRMAEKAADAPNEADIVPPPLVPEEPARKPDADAAAVIAKVRKLMLVSMAVTLIAVGSVFGFIGYRMFKGEGTTAKTADKLPEAPAIPADITLSLPRGARVIQSRGRGRSPCHHARDRRQDRGAHLRREHVAAGRAAQFLRDAVSAASRAPRALARPADQGYFRPSTLPSSSGLGRGPLKAETRVRFP